MLHGTATMRLDLSSSEIDLEAWLFGLSDADYRACSRGHLGAGVYHDDQGPGMVNVEAIGGNLLVQHYRAVRTGRDLMEMYSSASRLSILHVIPVVASVRWILSVRPISDSSSEFTCTVQVGLRPLLRALGRFMAAGWFLRRHVEEETAGFVADITRKHDAQTPDRRLVRRS